MGLRQKRVTCERATFTSILPHERGQSLTIGALATAAVKCLQTHMPKPPAESPASLPPIPSRRKWTIAHTAYVPFFAAIFELPWTFMFIVVVMANQTSAAGLSRTAVHILNVLGMAPALIGLLIGLIAVCNWRTLNLPKIICLILGSAGCLGFVWMFGSELMH